MSSLSGSTAIVIVSVAGCLWPNASWANSTAPGGECIYGQDANGKCCDPGQHIVDGVCKWIEEVTVEGTAPPPDPNSGLDNFCSDPANIGRPECTGSSGSGGGDAGDGGNGSGSGGGSGDQTDQGGGNADQTPGCWEELVAGQTDVNSGFRSASRPGHDGIDLSCATGTNVYAAEAGVIAGIPNAEMPEGHKVRSGFGTGGNMIVVTYESGRQARFLHLLPRNRQGVVVQVGDEVSAGQLLGACNDTGNSDGPHLHYDLMEDGQYLDPVAAHDCE